MYCPNPECPHVQATGEPAEYRLGVVHCNDCGTGLVERKPEKAHKGSEFDDEEFVPILEVRGAAMASFVKSLLQSGGIRFVIKGDLIAYGQLGTGVNPITGPPTLFVESSRSEEARELLAGIYEEREGGRHEQEKAMDRDQPNRPDTPIRPDKVRQAVTLLYVTLGLGVLQSIMEAQGAAASVALVCLSITWFFIHMIGKGKNWARITFLVLFIVGIPFSVLLPEISYFNGLAIAAMRRRPNRAVQRRTVPTLTVFQ